jgi:hypothetical protein
VTLNSSTARRRPEVLEKAYTRRMAARTILCGRCGELVDVKAASPDAELLLHGKSCRRDNDHRSRAASDDSDRTLTIRSGTKDRRKR